VFDKEEQNLHRFSVTRNGRVAQLRECASSRQTGVAKTVL
jgi:hypothetical protein